MRTRTQLLFAARSEVASRRQRAVTQALEARRRAGDAIPALAGAEAEARRLGLEPARLAACGAPPEAVAAAKEAAQAAQAALESLLRQNGYSPEQLKPRYACPLCEDTGRSGGRQCACVGQLARALRRQELARQSALAVSSFDTLDAGVYPDTPDPALGVTVREYMRRTLDTLRQYAEQFGPKSTSLLLYGNAGLGKTHAALAIAGAVLDKGFDVVYISAQEMCAELEKARFEDESPLMDAMLEADLLILDDLGTESLTSYSMSCFYTLVNTRMARTAPTIYTTNIVDGALLEQRYTEKIASRLSGSCEPVEFLGEDVRQLLHR